MPSTILRRQTIPRVPITATTPARLPNFLRRHVWSNTSETRVERPQKSAEKAAGSVWHVGGDPVTIDAFDPDTDIISVVIEGSDWDVDIDVSAHDDEVEILANGTPMARVRSPLGNTSFLSNIRVVRARSSP